MRKIEYTVIHCAATTAKMDIGAREIDRWHRERGFFSIGYHFVIRRNGVVEPGRPLEEAGAHAKGFNHNSIGVCMVGGLAADGKTAENNFTPEQWKALERLILGFVKDYPTAAILGHRDLPGVAKDCPSFDVREWLAGNQSAL